MRIALNRQLKLDIPFLDAIEFDPTSRHELEAILIALKHIYDKGQPLKEILALIAHDLKGESNTNTGCPGLSCWEIVVLAAVRLGCDLDYDALADLATYHRKLRRILGVGDWEDHKSYARSTIHENLVKLKPETLRAISDVIVALGHELRPQAITKVRGDSFVVQTNIHFPTDASLIVDGVRLVLRLSACLGELRKVATYRYWRTTFRAVKRVHRKIQKVAAKKLGPQEKLQQLKPLYEELIGKAADILQKALDFKGKINPERLPKRHRRQATKLVVEIEHFLVLTARVTDLAFRRVVDGEEIPHEEKIFSIFETHTELINRGKFPFPIEFGHRVFVVEDQARFIVDHQVMKPGRTDDQVACEVLKTLQHRMNNRIKVASFDKGCWSPKNFKELEGLVEVACLPKKGKRNLEARLRESSNSFRQARRWHPGIESAIHALVEGNGLAVCRDRGEEGYARYVALGILGRNLHTLGRILLQQQKQQQERILRAA